MTRPRKQRQTAVGEFILTMSEANKEQLDRFMAIPNIGGKEIREFLETLGFEGSLASVYNWMAQRQSAGAKAAELNIMLKEFQGVDHGKILEKLLCTLSIQLDGAISAIANQPIEGEHYIKALPAICRELNNTVVALNELRYIKDKKSLELSGATRLGRGLMNLFKNEAFIEALEEGINAIIVELEEST
jgi:hypothetical protein